MKARTFLEWCDDRYAWEHALVGVLLGVLAALVL